MRRPGVGRGPSAKGGGWGWGPSREGDGGPRDVECAGVSRRFGSAVALDGADLTVPAGTVVAVLGPSGCGKSTLLRVIAGFERPDAGTVTVGGNLVAGPGRHLPPERRGVGIVPQEQALFPHLSVAANVGYGLARSRPDRARRVDAMLELAGLTGLGARMPHELSGGQQQRVALARALAPEPAVVLLDEPFANLDAALRVALRAEVRQILRAADATAVVVTHDQEEALSTADLVAVMRAGRVVQVGAPEIVYRRPADTWVASFVGEANLLAGEALGDSRVTCALGRLACPDQGDGGGSRVQVLVRPEQLRLHPEDAAVEGAPAVVASYQFFGHDALAHLALGDGSALVARVTTGRLPAPGERVVVSSEGDVVCFPAA